jgi:hypothetical protein
MALLEPPIDGYLRPIQVEGCMLGRLLKGLIFGLLIGGVAAGLLIKGLGVTSFVVASGGFAFIAYASALVTGALVGLVAGKPIWAEGAWIEGLLKTFFGALLGAGAMFLARKFGTMEFPFGSAALGTGSIGELPIVTLPAIATVLAMFYEADNTDAPKEAEKGGRVAGKQAASKVRAPAKGGAGAGVETDDDGAEPPPPRAKKASK